MLYPETKRPQAYHSLLRTRWPRPSVTVDTLIFTVEERRVFLLLIQRKHDPYQGAWALPGAHATSL
jgi:ADP-ribose pyrophosphatase YjhB (NUDIX family)